MTRPFPFPPSPTGSAERPKTAHLLAARHLTPYAQGSLDLACGLYAIINGIRLACYPARALTHAEASWLFQLGLEYLDGRRGTRAHRWAECSVVALASADALRNDKSRV